MYAELELQYNNHGLIQLENKLMEDKRKLQFVFDDCKATFKMNKQHDRYLKQEEERSNRVRGRVSNVKHLLREEKQKVQK